MSKKAPTFREEMNSFKSSSIQAILKLRPRATESADKPIKKGLRWNKTSGQDDGGTVDEAGTSILQG